VLEFKEEKNLVVRRTAKLLSEHVAVKLFRAGRAKRNVRKSGIAVSGGR